MYSKVQGRPCSRSSSLLMRRKRRFTCTAIVLATLAALAALHQLLLLAYTYNDYILALLPKPHLPQQIRPVKPPSRSKAALGGAEGGPRILCLISTSPKYHETRARHVAATWSPHCTRAAFLTTLQDPALPEVVLTPGAATYEQLWEKVMQGFQWAYKSIGDFDWVVKADDDSFILLENLKAAVLGLDPDVPAAAGVHLRTWETGETYLNGGASYVLSRGAVRVLVEKGITGGRCQKDLQLGIQEDVNIAACLDLLGVVFLDSRDSEGRQRFHIYPPQELVDPRSETDLRHLWLKRISIYPYKFGYKELSDEVISFHYVDAETMYLIYYLVYLVNPQADPLHHPRSPLHPRPPLQPLKDRTN
ncbi:Glycoprotein-N-acetylgalactosamine 3-beta-galactosyltransferase 1 [Chionoecetes opilio]|uniref:N-acetylgalactosaminide beta-1,3-galactosyltransferase n=1 Tax=Chionoecetes opilio TaxID=41210 RepID=A0A8J5CDJ5_CHIOP|nr:Glycoprotein-N-acetylgalactosamine 3-beta-galactosyltransferase 1 [Chionoecetes opilio]